MSLGTTTISELQTDYLEATTRESGPNDSKRVVWASGEFFIIIRVFFSLQIIFIGTTSILELQTDYLEATTRESGPNDPRRVVWAIREFFFSIICFFCFIKSCF